MLFDPSGVGLGDEELDAFTRAIEYELSDEQLGRVARAAVAKKRSPEQALALLWLGGFWVSLNALRSAMQEAAAADALARAVGDAIDWAVAAHRRGHRARQLRDASPGETGRMARRTVAWGLTVEQAIQHLAVRGLRADRSVLDLAMREAEIARASAEIGRTMADRWGPGVGAAAGKVAGQFLAAVDRERQRRQEAESYELAHQVKLVFDEVLGPARPRRAPRVRLRSCPRPRSSRGARGGRRRVASRAGPDDDGGGEPGEPPPAPPRGRVGGRRRSRDAVERARRRGLRRALARAAACLALGQGAVR